MEEWRPPDDVASTRAAEEEPVWVLWLVSYPALLWVLEGLYTEGFSSFSFPVGVWYCKSDAPHHLARTSTRKATYFFALLHIPLKLYEQFALLGFHTH